MTTSLQTDTDIRAPRGRLFEVGFDGAAWHVSALGADDDAITVLVEPPTGGLRLEFLHDSPTELVRAVVPKRSIEQRPWSSVVEAVVGDTQLRQITGGDERSLVFTSPTTGIRHLGRLAQLCQRVDDLRVPVDGFWALEALGLLLRVDHDLAKTQWAIDLAAAADLVLCALPRDLLDAASDELKSEITGLALAVEATNLVAIDQWRTVQKIRDGHASEVIGRLAEEVALLGRDLVMLGDREPAGPNRGDLTLSASISWLGAESGTAESRVRQQPCLVDHTVKGLVAEANWRQDGTEIVIDCVTASGVPQHLCAGFEALVFFDAVLVAATESLDPDGTRLPVGVAADGSNTIVVVGSGLSVRQFDQDLLDQRETQTRARLAHDSGFVADRIAEMLDGGSLVPVDLEPVAARHIALLQGDFERAVSAELNIPLASPTALSREQTVGLAKRAIKARGRIPARFAARV